MSFTVRLSTDHIAVEPGSAHALSVEVSHMGDAAETYEIAVEGIDQGWVAIPMPSFEIAPHSVRAEKLLFRMPRETDSRAGTYPALLKVRSLVSGEAKSEQILLEIKPYHNINVDLHPKKGMVTPFAPTARFEVVLMNLGNQDETVQLYATDVDDLCVFEFEQDRILLSPGQQKNVAMTAGSGKKSWITSTRLHGFSVSARSTDQPGLMAASQAQLEQRPMISMTAVFGVVALGALASAWIYAYPKPPVITDLLLDKKVAMVGESIRVDWRMSHADSIEIFVNDELTKKSFDEKGFLTFVPSGPGVYRIVAKAREGKQIAEVSKNLTINSKPDAPLPEIDEFSVTPTKAIFGQSLTIRYRLGANVTRATLAPMGQLLDPKLDSLQVLANQVGDMEFTLVAESESGETTSRKVTIQVVKESKAKILALRAEQQTIAPGESTRLDWQATNAVRGELSDGITVTAVSNLTDGILVSPSKTTTYTLTVFDSDGEKITRSVKVTVKAPPLVKPPDENPATTGTEPPVSTGGEPEPAKKDKP
ncbi:MAG: hypothetical protein K8R88_04545 [Armatimonadetes bacterium]|nr:hypothetical protein [Armatimonadota bacterium]